MAMYNINIMSFSFNVLITISIIVITLPLSLSLSSSHFLHVRFHVISIYSICVASLQKGPHGAKIKIEIFLDLNRAGHDKPVKKN